MAVSPGATLRKLRAHRPLVHQITNYVVMNETANATLALGALPVMAHAPQEVEEMAANAGALVLNIGTLSEHWIEAMLLAGRAAKGAGPIVLDPVGAGATHYRTETAKRLLAELDVTVVRGNAAEIATLAGQTAEIRGVESISTASTTAEVVRDAARALGTIVSVTGPTDHVSDGERVVAVSNGHELHGNGVRNGLHVHGGHRLRSSRPSRTSRSRRRPRPSPHSAWPARTPRATRRARAPFTRVSTTPSTTSTRTRSTGVRR